MKKKILILGSSSFAGASMVNFLLSKNNYLVLGTYRRKKIKQYLPYKYNKNLKLFKEYQVDFSGKTKKILKFLFEQKPDYIIDFASICMVNESWKNPEVYFKTNVLFKAEMFKYLSSVKFLKKYIYVSTPEVFGSSNSFISEKNTIFNPNTPYATSKLSAEILLKNYKKIYYWGASEKPAVVRIAAGPDYTLPYKEEPQGEAIAWTDEGFVTLSERKDKKQKFYFYERK